MAIDYSEMLLPGALGQNPGVFLLSMTLILWLLIYGQKRGENRMTEESRGKRGTQSFNMVIIYINNCPSKSCLFNLHL